MANSTTNRVGDILRFPASFSMRFHCSGVTLMFFCVACAIRFAAPIVKVFIDSGPKRSENSSFLSPNTLAANRVGPEFMQEAAIPYRYLC